MTRSWSVLVCWIVLASLPGCYKYHGVITVESRVAREFDPLDNEALVKLSERVAHLADEFDLVPSADLALAQANRAEGDLYRPVGLFVGKHWRHQGLYLWIQVKEDGSEFRLVIRDMDSSTEEEFTRMLRIALEGAMVAHFGRERVRFEKTAAGPILYGG